MKLKSVFVFLLMSVGVTAQLMYHNADNLTRYIETHQISFYNIKMDLERQLKLFDYDMTKSSSVRYLEKNTYKNGMKPTYQDLIEFEEFYKYLPTYSEIKKEVKFYVYHNFDRDSRVALNHLPKYGKIKFNTYDANFVAAYHEGKEVKEKVFPFYTHIDSILVNLSYNYPIEIDTLRVSINKPNSHGFTLQRYKDFGVILSMPLQSDYQVVDVVGIDARQQGILSFVLQNYYTAPANQQGNFKKYRALLSRLNLEIGFDTASSVDELLQILRQAQSESGFQSGATHFSPINNYLIQTKGEAEELVLYLSKKQRYHSENFVIYNSDANSRFAVVNRNRYDHFYDVSQNKLDTSNKYTNIEHLGDMFYATEIGSFENYDVPFQCQTILINEKFEKKILGECDPSPFLLPNGGLVLPYLDREEMEEIKKIFDAEGNLRHEGVETFILGEHIPGSNFLIERDEEGLTEIIFSNFSKTKPLKKFFIYSGNRIIIEDQGLYGVFDDHGKTRIPYRYDSMEALDDTTLLVTLKGKQMIINDSNQTLYTGDKQEVLSPITPLEDLTRFDFKYLGLVQFEVDGVKGIKDTTGKIIYPVTAQDIYEVGIYRIAVINEAGKLGVINEKGEVIIPFVYDAMNPYFQGYALLIDEDNLKFYFYDRNGQLVSEYQAENFYRIVGSRNDPHLILDDKLVIGYNGKPKN